VPRYASARTLLAPVEDVWAFIADPYRLADWWPGIAGVEPDRRGVAPGARWRVNATAGFPSGRNPIRMYADLRRPGASGTLLVIDVVPRRRLAFQLVDDRIDAVLDLEPAEERRTHATLAVDVSWLSVRRSFPATALRRLYDLVQTSAEA
jgi:uncharacterized protein YndB with AHSA1/START domain